MSPTERYSSVHIIDKPIADLYKIDRNTQVEVTPEKDGINIRFLNAPSDEEVVKVAKGINKRYGKMMKNLAK